MSRAEEATDEAAAWILRQEEGDWGEDGRTAFEAWLGQSDGNRAAYWRLKHSWRQTDRIGALGRGRSTPARETFHRQARRWSLRTALAASVAVALGTGYLVWAPRNNAISTEDLLVFATPVGGQRVVSFSDGSRIQLNTDSTIRARISPLRRDVWLDRGEAFFEVAHRRTLPFVVHAGTRQVTVLGTKFDVRRQSGGVKVVVLQGSVRLDDMGRNGAIRSTIVTAHDIAFARGPSTLVETASSGAVEGATAWRVGMLSFEHATLADVAAELNRYNERKISVTDRAAAETRIGGLFPTRDPATFVRLLHDAYGLTITETGEEIKISS